MPADQPISQRYTAGTCTLETKWRPSPLSQWSDRPIASHLSFELWLQTKVALGQDCLEDTPTRNLIAQGDRTKLQAIAQYIQDQIHSQLALTHINSASQRNAINNKPHRRPTQAHTHQPIQGLQQSSQQSLDLGSDLSLDLSKPLSYLQLCDISTVLSQLEQTASLLPVELSPSVEAIPSNVIPLEAARRTRPSPQRNSRNRRVWASSAAAAVFAVGLTTTLWSRDSALRQVDIATDTAAPEALEDETQYSEAPLPEREITEREMPAPAGETPTLENEASPPENETAAGETSFPQPLSGSDGQANREPSIASDRTANQNSSQSATEPAPNAEPTPTEGRRESSQTAADEPADLPEDFAARSPAPSSEARPEAKPETNPEEASRQANPSTADPPQVQRYFQQQWQSIAVGPLAYRLQLSNTGEVISFTALDEISAAYRDRLLPPNNAPVFTLTPPTENSQASASELTLRILIDQNGLVEVMPF